MLESLNRIARTTVPSVHKRLKPLYHTWCRSQFALITPVRKRMGPHSFWCHPRFLSGAVSDFEPSVSRWLESHLSKGAVLFDIGANFGFHALPATQFVGKRGRVIAFEPSPANLAILRYHKEVNRLHQ